MTIIPRAARSSTSTCNTPVALVAVFVTSVSFLAAYAQRLVGYDPQKARKDITTLVGQERIRLRKKQQQQ